MAKFIAEAQTLTAGTPLNFSAVRSSPFGLPTSTTAIKVKGSGCDCRPRYYIGTVHLVITATAASQIRLALYVNGVQQPDTVMAAVPAAIGDVISLDAPFEVGAGAEAVRISVQPTVTNGTLQSGVLIVTPVKEV